MGCLELGMNCFTLEARLSQIDIFNEGLSEWLSENLHLALNKSTCI